MGFNSYPKIQILFKNINKKICFFVENYIVNSKKTLELILFLRFSARKRENAACDLKSALELFSEGRLPGDIPLHWNFPVHPILAEGNTETVDGDPAAAAVREIQRRTAAKLDILLPMGYGGAYHALLTDEELRQEYNWAFTNPRRTGFEDVFGTRPKLVMPAQMDFLRPSSRSFYNNAPCTWVAVPDIYTRRQTTPTGLHAAEVLDHGNMYYLPLLHLAPPVEEALKPLKKLSRRGISPLAVLIDFTNGNSGEDILSLFDAVERARQKADIRFVQMTRWLLPDRRQVLIHTGGGFSLGARVPGTMLPLVSLPHDPADRARRLEAGKKRFFLHQHDIENDSRPYREIILTANSLCKRSETVETRPNSAACETPVDRALIADMPGTVGIKESNFEAEFVNGRFSNIISDRGPLLSGMQAESYVRTNGKNRPFENAGVYSFESDEIRGLREALVLDAAGGGDGKLIIDYMFIRENPSLFISVDIRYPELSRDPPIDGYAPLELPLFRFGPEDSLTAAGVYPDGTQYTLLVPSAGATYDLPGHRFIITKNDTAFTLSFPFVEDLPVEIVPALARQEKKGCLFCLNPKGSYRPSEARFISGFTEHFTLMISAGASKSGHADVPAAVIACLQKPWLGKLDK